MAAGNQVGVLLYLFVMAVAITGFSLGIYATSKVNQLSPVPAPPPQTGMFLRALGESVSNDPLVAAACNLYDQNGNFIGTYLATLTDSSTNLLHAFTLNDGRAFQIKIGLPNDQLHVFPIDAGIVGSFPEFAPYLNNSDYSVAFGDDTHFKTGDSSVLEWTVTAPTGDWMNDATRYEARCVFLLYKGKIIACRGCIWYLAASN